MKKIIYFIAVLAIVSCKNEPKDYVTFSGKITNQNSDSIVIRNRGYSKTIKVNEDGTFSDTLKVKTGSFSFFDGKEQTLIYLKNGYDINMTLDTKMFDETTKYTGIGAESNNFLAEKALLEEKLFDQEFKNLDTKGINEAFDKIKEEVTTFINSKKGVDKSVIDESFNQLESNISGYKNYLLGTAKLKEILPKGAPSPIFDGYENYNGSKTSLKDLKGKYVYVDVWATWCGPCKAEIPSLKKVEKAYHGKNIAFVSLSVDDDRSHGGSWKKANENWRKMVKEKELAGIQLFAPKGWQSSFVTGYMIKGIPRFILIDPNGNIVTPDAPRPSSPELIKLFDQENI